MNSSLIKIPDNVDCASVDSLNNYLVWRYVKDEHKSGESEVASICFCLTARDNGHVSFCHSNEKDVDRMVSNIHKNIRVAGKTKPALYLSIDIKEAYEQINSTKMLITFKACGYPHIGMFYLDYSNMEDRNLIIASLVELSDTYFRAEGGAVHKVE
ncbi:hypothetical protein M1I87_005331 [Serratia marcescens]|nr:hypothetical protein [Serratia marcescens]